MTQEEPKQDEVKKVEGHIKLHKAMPYKGDMIYIRQFGVELFEYLVVHQNQLYSSYIIVKPEEGKKEMNQGQTMRAIQIIFSGAVTTVDQLTKPPEKDKKLVNKDNLCQQILINV
ncbi:MAG: hypothetical protein NUV73_04455 [Candidatus Daviesbacteria bacterium]|nr:hypothetical protein [Candidatus Daviesbacteria bacterium]